MTQQKTKPKASLSTIPESSGSLEALLGFREKVYSAFTSRADALFELSDALLHEPGRIEALPYLSLSDRFNRGHDMIYQALNKGKVNIEGLRSAVLRQDIPLIKGRIVLAVDGTPWLRPDANLATERSFCHVHGRGGSDFMVPGWSYSFVSALASGASSWTLPLDVQRIDVQSTETEIAIVQIRRVVVRLKESGQWRDGDPTIVVVTDSGYTPLDMFWALQDLPVTVVCRVRSNRAFYGPPPVKEPDGETRGRPAVRGPKMRLDDSSTWVHSNVSQRVDTERYGCLEVLSFDSLHQRLTRQQKEWLDDERPLPIIEGTVIRLKPERLPHDGKPDPVWLWVNETGLNDVGDIDEIYMAWLRRFDLEHTNRFIKQYLGFNMPRLREAAAADMWVILVWVAYLQLYMARGLVGDRPFKWEKPLSPDQLTPLRIKRGFRYLGGGLMSPSEMPKTRSSGHGRVKGSKNRRKASVQPVGKNPKNTPGSTHRKKKIPQG